jgi:hypothetical protein
MLADADVDACWDGESGIVVCMLRNRARDQVAEIQDILNRDENAEGELLDLVDSLEQIRDLIREQVPI